MKKSKLAEMGLIKILSEIKTPLTNITLCIELLQNDDVTENKHVYYEIMKKSAHTIEDSVKDLCKSFSDLGISIYMPPDETMLDSIGN